MMRRALALGLTVILSLAVSLDAIAETTHCITVDELSAVVDGETVELEPWTSLLVGENWLQILIESEEERLADFQFEIVGQGLAMSLDGAQECILMQMENPQGAMQDVRSMLRDPETLMDSLIDMSDGLLSVQRETDGSYHFAYGIAKLSLFGRFTWETCELDRPFTFEGRRMLTQEQMTGSDLEAQVLKAPFRLMSQPGMARLYVLVQRLADKLS
ncbi:MAG: hypothetical protein SOV75_10445 [Candidatus Limiplasma sp.]|nr:hypothetical protein [Candidatus Limiplasma sp.]